MAQTGRYHGGLVIVGPTDGALDRLSRVVTATLEDYGHPVERQSVLSLTEARVISSGYMVKITLADLRGDARHRRDAVVGLNARRRQQMDHPAQRAVIEMLPVAAGQEDPELTELMLVVMLYRVADIFAISQVEWLSPETILTVDQFLGAFISVSPRRVRGRQQVLPPEPDPFSDGPGQPKFESFEARNGRK